MRRASPSNSISASATRNGSAAAISTERPRRFSTPDAIADPWSRSPRAVRCSVPIKYPRGGVPPASIASRRLRKLLLDVLIEANKLSQSHREGSVFVPAERVHAQRGFQAGHDNGETQRVQARVQQRQFIGQRREPPVLITRDLLELFENLRSNAHARFLRWQC